MTQVAIKGTEFWIDGRPTYPGREYEGHRIQGLLFNVRAVQAVFDDANLDTRRNWTYPDTGTWDPERNTDELCQALPTWREQGVHGLTVNFQGGGPVYVPEVYGAYDNNGFTPDGELKPAYAERMSRVLQAADAAGMVVIVGFFYWVSVNRMTSEAACWRAAREAMAFLSASGHGNVLVEIANETDLVHRNTPYDLFSFARQVEMVSALRDEYPGMYVSTSGAGVKLSTGQGMPPGSLVQAVDYVLIHGNGTRPPELAQAIQAVRAMPEYMANSKPIVINEDSPAVPNMDAAWRNGVSWGYYDQGFEGQADDPYLYYAPRPRWNTGDYESLNGFQTPPVNWGINTPFKKAFFDRVAEVTGARQD